MNLIVQTTDERLASFSKPALEAVAQFELTADDWLIVCAGFEERALGVLQNALAGQRKFNVIVIAYTPVFSQNKLAAIRESCDRAELNRVELLYNREEPENFGTVLLGKLAAVGGRIFIDVSAMSRLLIVQILVALGTRPFGFKGCFVAYAEAVDYPPTRAEAEAELAKCDADPTFSVLFLSSGVFAISVLPELSSATPAGAQTRLIAFPSLDSHQLTALRAEIQPSRFSLIEGIPPSPKNQWRKQVISQVNCLDEIQGAERIEVSTLDYRETLDALLKLYSTYSVCDRLVLTPTGSKMQTVAAGIFRAIVRDVQIAYPTSRGFRKPDEYTFGIGPLHVLPLGGFSSMQEGTGGCD